MQRVSGVAKQVAQQAQSAIFQGVDKAQSAMSQGVDIVREMGENIAERVTR
jgi:hypothetical protein